MILRIVCAKCNMHKKNVPFIEELKIQDLELKLSLTSLTHDRYDILIIVVVDVIKYLSVNMIYTYVLIEIFLLLANLIIPLLVAYNKKVSKDCEIISSI